MATPAALNATRASEACFPPRRAYALAARSAAAFTPLRRQRLVPLAPARRGLTRGSAGRVGRRARVVVAAASDDATPGDATRNQIEESYATAARSAEAALAAARKRALSSGGASTLPVGPSAVAAQPPAPGAAGAPRFAIPGMPFSGAAASPGASAVRPPPPPPPPPFARNAGDALRGFMPLVQGALPAKLPGKLTLTPPALPLPGLSEAASRAVVLGGSFLVAALAFAVGRGMVNGTSGSAAQQAPPVAATASVATKGASTKVTKAVPLPPPPPTAAKVTAAPKAAAKAAAPVAAKAVAPAKTVAPAAKAAPVAAAKAAPVVAKAAAPAAAAKPVVAAPKAAAAAPAKATAAPPAVKPAPAAAPKAPTPALALAKAAPAPALAAAKAPVAAAPAPAATKPAPAKSAASHAAAQAANAHADGFTVGEEVVYALQSIFRLPLLGKIAVFAAFASVAVLIGGTFYALASGVRDGAYFKAYSYLNNVPGIDIVGEATPAALIAANALFVAGVFTFALLVGFVSESVASGASAVVRGNGAVVERGHSVVLNWNAAAPPLVRQLAPGRGEKVIVMAQQTRDELDALVDEAMVGMPRAVRERVITRQGDPADLSDLRRVAAGSASHVVLLHSHGSGGSGAAEEQQAAALLGVQAQRGRTPPRITVQLEGRGSCDDDGGRASLVELAVRARARAGEAGAALAARVQPVDARAAMARTLAQCTLQPGLAAVYADGLSVVPAGETHAAAAALHALPLPRRLEGATFGAAWRAAAAPVAGYTVRFICFPGCMQAGCCNACADSSYSLETQRPTSDGGVSVHLAPSDTTVLLRGDSLVVFARSGREAASRATAPAPRPVPLPAAALEAHAAPAAPQHVVVAGLERTGAEEQLLSSLAGFLTESAGRGTTVAVISSSLTPGDVARHSTGHVRFRLVRGTPAQGACLRDAGAGRADHLLLLQPPASASPGAPGGADAGRDAKLVAALLHMADMRDASPEAGPRHVLASVEGPNAPTLAHRAAPRLALDLIDLHRLTAGALAGSVVDPLVPAVVNDLNSPGDAELHIRAVEEYLPPGALAPGAKPLRGWDVAAAARARGDVFVGYVAAGDAKEAPGIVMAPRRDAQRVWQRGEALVVVSDHGPPPPAAR
jgi:hypothetical protein